MSQVHAFLCGEVCAYYRTHAAAIRQSEVTDPHDGLISTASPRQYGAEPSQSERPGVVAIWAGPRHNLQ